MNFAKGAVGLGSLARTPYRRDLERGGYVLVRTELAAFEPEG